MEKSSLHIYWTSHSSPTNNLNTINRINYSSRLSHLDNNQSNWSKIHPNQNSNINSLHNRTHRSTCRGRTLSSWNNYQIPPSINPSNQHQHPLSPEISPDTLKTETQPSTMGNWHWTYGWRGLSRWNSSCDKGCWWRMLERDIIVICIDECNGWMSLCIDGYVLLKGMSKCTSRPFRRWFRQSCLTIFLPRTNVRELYDD